MWKLNLHDIKPRGSGRAQAQTHLRHKPEFSGVFPREIIHKLSMSQGKDEDEDEHKIDTLEN